MDRRKYSQLHQIAKKASILQSIQNVLEWDQETHMPAQGIEVRTMQIETLATLSHKQKTSPQFKKALQALIDLESGEVLQGDLTTREKAALREWRRDFLKHKKLPASFVKKWALATTMGSHTWIKAKESANFKEFLPQLKKIIDLAKKKSDYLGFEEHPYDALLDLYEPGMKTSTLTKIFFHLKEGLTSLLQKIESKRESFNLIHGDFDPEKQMAFGKQLMAAMGLESSLCRLDQSAHPFCMGIHMKDTRITTRIHPSLFLSNIFSVIHEGGHALYNMGLPAEEFGSPLGEQVSLGMDESQSRFWETRIGRSKSFWKYFLPHLQDLFPERLKEISLEQFYLTINTVKPSFIRVEADEVTYSLHVILRFEIEKSLIEGSLKVDHIPEVWNAKMEEYLGIVPKNDAMGCLQDIHWSMGGIGYFPTYTLGNLYAAQFFIPFEKENPNWKEEVALGKLGFIREWLKEKIHRFGREYSPDALITRISGEPLSEKYFLDYLNKKYKEIYNL